MAYSFVYILSFLSLVYVFTFKNEFKDDERTKFILSVVLINLLMTISIILEK